MIQFNEIQIHNYNSIEDVQTDLNDLGLVLVSGKNDDGENAVSNGAGKSSVFEAIFWVLYGQDPVGRRKEVIKEGRTSCRVELDFNINNDKYTIFRERVGATNVNFKIVKNGIQLSFKDNTEAQNFLESEVLYMDKFLFRNSIYYSPLSLKFFDNSFTDLERKQILLKAMGIDYILENALELTKQKLSVIKKDKEAEEIKLREVELTIDNLDLNGIRNNYNMFETTRKQNIKRLEDRIQTCNLDDSIIIELESKRKEIEDEISKNERFVQVNSKETEKFFNEIESKRIIIEEQNKQLFSLGEEISDLNNKYNNNKNSADSQQKSLDNIEKNKVCPLCGAFNDSVDVKKHSWELKDSISKLLSKNRTIKVDVEKLKKDYDKVNLRIIELKKEIEGTKDKIKKHSNSVDVFRNVIIQKRNELKGIIKQIENWSEIKNKIDQIEKEKELELNKVNPYKDLVNKAIEKLKDLNSKKNEIEKVLKKVDDEFLEYNWWLTGFGVNGVINYLIDFIVKKINSIINSFLFCLSQGELKGAITYQIQGKKKEGRLSFETDIYPHGNVKPSSGQQRKIDLAISFALNYILGSGGMKSNILILDEVLDGVDSEGKKAIISLIREMNKSSVFLISHEEEFLDLFDKRWIITKKNGESRLCQE